MHPPTDEEFPQVNFASDMPWEPQLFDNEYSVDDLDLSADDLAKAEYHPSLNDYGEINQNDHDDLELFTMCTAVAKVCGNKHIVGIKQRDPKHLAPNFSFIPEERIQKTIDHTIQFACMDTRLPLRKHFKSRFPAANVSCLNETVAMDTFFFDVPALDDGIMGHGGITMLQLYCGCDSQLTAVFPMKTGRNGRHSRRFHLISWCPQCPLQ
jgi:hypothetical protein